jgi:hypothetical protein
MILRASIGFARAVQPAYFTRRERIWAPSSSSGGLDDVTAVGRVDSVLGVYDRLATALEHVGCTINRVKTKLQVPMGDPPDALLLGASGEESRWCMATSRLLGA